MRPRLRQVSAPGSVEHELALLERRLRAELRAELDARLLELRQHVDEQLEQLETRVDGIHRRALRALTHTIGGKTP